MLKHIIELILVVILGIFPVAPQKAEIPVTNVTEYQVTSQMSDDVLYSRFENMLNHNQLFGDDFSSKNAIADAACTSLADRISDGYISKPLVDSFVYSMYGIDLSDYTANSDKIGFYPVEAHGYSSFSHKVTSVLYNNDGTVTVHSDATISGDGNNGATAEFESVFFANGASAFSYNLISCKAC